MIFSIVATSVLKDFARIVSSTPVANIVEGTATDPELALPKAAIAVAGAVGLALYQ